MKSLANVDDLQCLRDRLLSVQPQDAARWGVMNSGEMICHVRGAFFVAMGEIPCEPFSLSIPAALLKSIALWGPLEWRHNFQTVPVLERGAPEMHVGDFEPDRTGAIEAMNRFCAPEQRRVDHAFFGKMSPADWLRWGFLHTDHHLRQFGR